MTTSFLSRFTTVAFAALVCLGLTASVSAQALMDASPTGIEIQQPHEWTPAEAGGPITFYSDRPTFDAAHPGLPCEDLAGFTDTILGCDGPANNGTECVGGYGLGEILPGIEYSADPGPTQPTQVIISSGFDGNAETMFGANFFTDELTTTYSPSVAAVGTHMQSFIGSGACDVSVFDGTGALVATAAGVPCGPGGAFIGMDSNSPNGIGAVHILDVGGGAEAVDNTCFGEPPVPVELIHFGAVVTGTDVTLDWATASETNNAGFEVQMLTGESWNALGFVEGHGTTTEAQTYSYSADMGVGTHSFRLKQIDFDGAFEYSSEVEVTVETPGSHVLSAAYPNPFNPQSQFTLAVAQDQLVTAELFNTLGQRVAVLFSGTVEANQSQLVTIDGAGLASGMYVVRVNGERFSDALRVTLLK